MSHLPPSLDATSHPMKIPRRSTLKHLPHSAAEGTVRAQASLAPPVIKSKSVS